MTTQKMDKAVRFYVARAARDAAQREYDKAMVMEFPAMTPRTWEAFKVARDARDAAQRAYDQAWALYAALDDANEDE